MYLRFYLDENGEKVYTTKKEANGLATQSAHPAPFSPDDTYSRERIALKKRFNLLPTQQPCPILCMGPVSSIDKTNIKASADRGTDHLSYSDGTIIKPPTDRRDYKFIQLSNGLRALLVHDPWIYLDPSTDNVGVSVPKKGAAMTVNLGSLADPKDAPGLAHFLEHMLFLGSTTFPGENEFDSYLSEHGGFSNAYTQFEHTCYHFDVEGKALFGALKRFAEMFISPRLNPEAMQREINSIDSEFIDKLQNDSARLRQLQFHTSTPGHPLNRFCWGNKTSLSKMMEDVDPRDCLMKLHDDYCCGESMNLVVIGGESLDILERWVRELFCPIKKTSPVKLQTDSNGRIWNTGNVYKSKALEDVHILELSWELPSLAKSYLTKGEEYLSHLLGHEGKGSILNLLKTRGLATSINVGVDTTWMFRFSFAYIFRVVIHLTDEGTKKIFEVISYVYQFLKLMGELSPQKWVFDELQKIGKVDFLMAKEKREISYAAHIVENLRVYPPHHVLYGEHAYDVWDEKIIWDILGLLKPGNMRVDLQTMFFKKPLGSKIDIEPWFNIEYVVEAIPTDMLQSWASSHTIDPSLHFPSKNPFISRNVSIRLTPTPSRSIWELENPVMNMWCKFDDNEKFPLVRTRFTITLNGADTNDKTVLMTRIFILLLNDELSEIIYMANEARLETSIVYRSGKLVVNVNGLIESIPAYLSEVIKVLKSFSIKDYQFRVIKKEMERYLSNAHTKPLDYSNYNLKRILFRGFRSAEAQLEELKDLSHVDLANIILDLMSKVHIEGHCYGNLQEAEASQIFDLFLRNFSKPLERMASMVSIMILPPSADLVKDVRPRNDLDKNSSVQFYFQIGRNTTELYTLAKLFQVLVQEQFYDELRTKQQLGYLVSCGVRINHGMLGFYFYVQSSKFTPEYVQEQIIAFIQGIREMLGLLNKSEFENRKAGSFGFLLEIENQECFCETSEVGNSDIGLILCGVRQEMIEKEFCTKTKNDLSCWYNKYLMNPSPSRRLLVIRVWGDDKDMENSKVKASSMQAIEDIDDFKRRSKFYEKELEDNFSSL